MAIPTKKSRTNRKALKTSSEANILAAKTSQPSPSPAVPMESAYVQKENHESLSQTRSPGKKKGPTKKSTTKQQQSFEKDLQEMQERLEQLRLEKEKTEDILKEKDEMLRLKEEELETKGKQQEKLQLELKKLQKLKEFKPTMTFPVFQCLRDKEQEKKDKKQKGASGTKRPSPPYVLWCKDQWAEVKKSNPEAEFKEVSNILGSKWKTVTAEEKKPYEEKYQAEKEAYLQIVGKEKRENEAMKLLEEEHKQKTAMELLDQYMQFLQEAENEKRKPKKEKDPLKPKQPMSAYFLFSNERRAALLAENKTVLEAAKIMGEEWKNMTEKQRGTYEKMAKKNKEKYLQEIEAYKGKKEEESLHLKMEEEELMKIQKQEALQLLKKKEKAVNIIKKTKENRQKKKKQKSKITDPNKPKRPASSFILFSKEARKTLAEERPGVNNSTLNALISVKWKELGEEERQIWNGKAATAMEQYKKELEEYNKSVADAASVNEDGKE